MRAKLSLAAIPGLNDWLIARAEKEGCVPRWHGLLLVAASLHNVHECGERQFLFEHLDQLSPDDLLLLDRGYPCCCWLVALLNHRAIRFCMRVDNANGFAALYHQRWGIVEAFKRLKR